MELVKSLAKIALCCLGGLAAMYTSVIIHYALGNIGGNTSSSLTVVSIWAALLAGLALPAVLGLWLRRGFRGYALGLVLVLALCAAGLFALSLQT